MVAIRRKIKAGDFLLSKKDEHCVREALTLQDGEWSYIEYQADDDEPVGGLCSTNRLLSWGTHITRSQAFSIIGNIDIQRENLSVATVAKLRESLKLAEAKVLIDELVRRGYRVIKKEDNTKD